MGEDGGIVDGGGRDAIVGDDGPERKGDRGVDDQRRLETRAVDHEAQLAAGDAIGARASPPTMVDGDGRRDARVDLVSSPAHDHGVGARFFLQHLARAERDGQVQLLGRRDATGDVQQLEGPFVGGGHHVDAGVRVAVHGAALLERGGNARGARQDDLRGAMSPALPHLEAAGALARSVHEDARLATAARGSPQPSRRRLERHVIPGQEIRRGRHASQRRADHGRRPVHAGSDRQRSPDEERGHHPGTAGHLLHGDTVHGDTGTVSVMEGSHCAGSPWDEATTTTV